MNVLTIDTGGTHVKVLATGNKIQRKFFSGPTLTPRRMVSAVKKLAGDWEYDVVAIGYPGLVIHGRPVLEPHNLAPGWVDFDFATAFRCPVKVINDTAKQALGSYHESGLTQLDTALDRVELAAPKLEKALLEACVQVVSAGGVIQKREADLLRAIADTLDCPIPPFMGTGVT